MYGSKHPCILEWLTFYLVFRPPRQRAASCVWTIRPREEREWSQHHWAASKIERAVSWAQHMVCVPYTLPITVLMISCAGSVHCLLYGRG